MEKTTDKSASNASAKAQDASSSSMKNDITQAIEKATEVLTNTIRQNFEDLMEVARSFSTPSSADSKMPDVTNVIKKQTELAYTMMNRNIEAFRQLNEMTLVSLKESCEPYMKQVSDMFNINNLSKFKVF